MPNASDLNNTKNIIELNNVSKVYPETKDTAIHDVTFSVIPEEFVCLIGSSGCGKSTVLKLIAGLEVQTGGTIKKPLNLAMDFQSGALFPWLTIFDNVAFGLRAKRVPEATVHRETMKYVELMKLQDYVMKYPANLSGGQHQRVGIARALAINPAVLLLDEPFSALDPKTTAELHDDLLKIWKETKKTIVMVSHLIEEAVSLADRVILMKEGTIEKMYPITISRPRRELEMEFSRHVSEIRKDFFK